MDRKFLAAMSEKIDIQVDLARHVLLCQHVSASSSAAMRYLDSPPFLYPLASSVQQFVNGGFLPSDMASSVSPKMVAMGLGQYRSNTCSFKMIPLTELMMMMPR